MSVFETVEKVTDRASSLISRDHLQVARPTKRIPIAVHSAYEATLIDENNTEVTDLTSGWNVVNTGWNHPYIIKAIKRQLDETMFAPPWCTHRGRVEIAERLSNILQDDWKALCVASGSEAVEAALKVARRATGRQTVIGFTEAYHGGTLGAMMAGGVPAFKGVDLPVNEFHRHIPIPDQLRINGRNYAKLASDIIKTEPFPAAVLLEPIFTNPGVIYGDEEFYRSISEACASVGALIIMDEVGTGFGRTGKMFGFQHWPIKPDIICIAKALTSGAVPMAGALIRSELAKAISGPGFSSTFGWTPLACAAAHASLDIIKNENLIERSLMLGKLAFDQLRLLEKYSHVAAVRGKGLEIGIELVDSKSNPVQRPIIEELTKKLLLRGVFLEPSAYTSTLLIMPPLIISEQQLRAALNIVIEEVSALIIQ